MRRAFLTTLQTLAESDQRIVFLTADLGFSVIEKFQEKFPDRFINVGVSEQNLIALCTGLAKAGMIPFAYSIIPFAVLRTFEFIRNGPVLHNLQVRIVGIGGGFEYGHDGMTHYGLEDIGVLRTQPNMRIIVPSDYEQAQNALINTYDIPGPIYYRLGKDETSRIEGLQGRFGNGMPTILLNGQDMIFLCYGPISFEVLKAAKTLIGHGIFPTVAIVDMIQPLNHKDVAQIISGFRLVVTVEAHYSTGGIGSLMAEIIADEDIPCKLLRLGINRLWDGKTGSEKFLLDYYGLSAKKIADSVLEKLV